MGKLVKATTKDCLDLHGYYSPSTDRKTVVLHIHGFEGNFYENSFVRVLTEELEGNNVGFLAVNTRGNGKDTDFYYNEAGCKRIGARYELLEDAHLDISAWMKYLIEEKYKEIVLMGHSLGTMKVVRYLFEGDYRDKVSKLILLAPFDKKGMMQKDGLDIDKLLRRAQELIDGGNGKELVTKDFGDIVVSYETFTSLFRQDDLGRMFEFCSKDYAFPVLKQIKVPTKIIVGSKDEYFHLSNPDHPEEAMQILLKNIPNSQGAIIDGAVHSFFPQESKMAEEVAKYVQVK